MSPSIARLRHSAPQPEDMLGIVVHHSKDMINDQSHLLLDRIGLQMPARPRLILDVLMICCTPCMRDKSPSPSLLNILSNEGITINSTLIKRMQMLKTCPNHFPSRAKFINNTHHCLSGFAAAVEKSGSSPREGSVPSTLCLFGFARRWW